jgi:hypothetical protein
MAPFRHMHGCGADHGFAVPSTKVSNVSAELRRFLGSLAFYHLDLGLNFRTFEIGTIRQLVPEAELTEALRGATLLNLNRLTRSDSMETG